MYKNILKNILLFLITYFVVLISSYCENDTTTIQPTLLTTIINRFCLPNEISVECTKPSCEPTCHTVFNQTTPCNSECGPPGCQCKPGTVRSGRYCIRTNFCPGICCSITNPQKCIICPKDTLCSIDAKRVNFCKNAK
uniref:TIL domain-containing protein n=1 Tax=Meloidogyne incognita TaxID=6306 RepID=A0A914N1D5_MELIC